MLNVAVGKTEEEMAAITEYDRGATPLHSWSGRPEDWLGGEDGHEGLDVSAVPRPSHRGADEMRRPSVRDRETGA